MSEQQNLGLRAVEWILIREAGGIDGWVRKELLRLGLIDEADTTKLSDAEKKVFKARREEERRVRDLLKKEARASYRRAHLVHLGRGVFHHDTPDIDKFDAKDPEGRRKENNLPEIKDAGALAQLLGLTIPRLRWLIYHREVDRGTHYHRWLIPKRTGGERLISAPKPDLKKAQQWIRLNITEHLPVHGAAHGFLPGRSVLTNALPHAGADVLVKIDVKDFYPSVTFPRVKGLFRKAGFGEQVATVLALLCTESPREEFLIGGERYYVAVGDRSLPQGAPTSPSITNTICLGLDGRLAGLAEALGLEYSRYADDLAFSWRKTKKNTRPPLGRLIHSVKKILAEEGFTVHPEKTQVMRTGTRQRVTGLVVNEAPDRPAARIPRETLRKLKAALHHREHGDPGKGESLEELRGLAAWVHMVDPVRGGKFLQRIDALAAKK